MEPKEPGPATKKPTEDAIKEIKEKIGVDITGIEANDWYTTFGIADTSGKVEYEGRVYYMDCMAEGDLPDTWKDDYPPAQGLRASHQLSRVL